MDPKDKYHQQNRVDASIIDGSDGSKLLVVLLVCDDLQPAHETETPDEYLKSSNFQNIKKSIH